MGNTAEIVGNNPTFYASDNLLSMSCFFTPLQKYVTIARPNPCNMAPQNNLVASSKTLSNYVHNQKGVCCVGKKMMDIKSHSTTQHFLYYRPQLRPSHISSQRVPTDHLQMHVGKAAHLWEGEKIIMTSWLVNYRDLPPHENAGNFMENQWESLCHYELSQ